MSQFRFSLSALFGLVAFVAVGTAAMANPAEMWVVAIMTSTIGMLFFGSLAAIHGSGEWRAFWSGFTFIGTVYLALVACLEFYSAFAHIWFTRYLATARLLDWFCSQIFMPGTEEWHNAQIIGEFLWALVVGFVGGITARKIRLRTK